MLPDDLQKEHIRLMEQALRTFKNIRKMGGPEFSSQYADQLQAELEETYGNYTKHNESKNIFAAARTPSVLFALVIVCYVLSGVLGVVGLETFANLVNMCMLVVLGVLATWAYTRYSGEHRQIGSTIDRFAEQLWEQVRLVICNVYILKISKFF